LGHSCFSAGLSTTIVGASSGLAAAISTKQPDIVERRMSVSSTKPLLDSTAGSGRTDVNSMDMRLLVISARFLVSCCCSWPNSLSVLL